MKASELRQSILQAAVQGKLVPQDLHDEPATKLLERIHAEKSKLIKEGKLKKDNPLPQITEDEIPYDLPEGWVWCRLNEVVLFVATGPFGSMLHKSDYVQSGIPLVNPANMRNGIIIPSDKMMVDEATRDRLSSYVLHEGDVTVARRGELGRCAVVTANEDGWICGTGSFFLRVVANVFIRYFLLFFQSKPCRDQLMGESVGSTMNNLNHTILKNVYFPLPPVASQKRIVSKVDELMMMCDELEAAENEMEALDKHFIEYLPKSILQMAVQGKLVPQNLHDEPAEKLLERIRTEKAKLIKVGKLKKEKPLPPIAEDEIPYDLPEGWVWCRLEELVRIISGTSYKKDNVQSKGVRILRGGNIQDHRVLLLEDDVFLPSDHYDIEKTIQNNDIVIVASTGSSTVIGKPGFASIDVVGSQIGAFLRIVRPVTGDIFEYLKIIFSSEFYREHIRIAAQGTNINNVKNEYISEFIIPLPSLAEQQRIVAKLDVLMALCDELKSAKTDPVKRVADNIAPFPRKVKPVPEYEIGIAARGDGGGLPQEALDDLAEIFRDDEDG